MTLVNVLFSMALDVALAFIAAQFAAAGEGILVFGIVLAVVFALPIALGLWGLVKFWLSYHLYLKKRLVRYYLAEFHRCRFPDAREHFDWEAYLAAVVEAGDVDSQAKSKASFICGEVASLRSTNPMTMGLAVALSLNAAMEQLQVTKL